MLLRSATSSHPSQQWIPRHLRSINAAINANSRSRSSTTGRVNGTTIHRSASPSLLPPRSRCGYSFRSFSASSYSDQESTTLPDHHHHLLLPLTVFSEEEELIRNTARQWAQTELSPKVREMEHNERIDPSIIQQLFDMGFMGMEINEEHGGNGMNFTSACLVVEELSRADPSVGLLVDIHNTLIINALRKWASQPLRQTWFPRLAQQYCVGAFLLSEANAGSDAFALQTTATPSDDRSQYVLNGTKLWISNAREAGMMLVFANAEPTLGHRGITAFVIDVQDVQQSTTAGTITIGPSEKKLGLRASSTCPVHLDNVIVPSSQILGEVGKGYRYCMEILNEGRIGIAAQQLGIAKACLHDIAMPYLMDRHQFGQPIGHFQGMQHQYAELATELQAAELLTYNACRLQEMIRREENADDGQAAVSLTKQASMAKYYANRVAEKAASKSIEWLGGIGFTQDMLVEKFYRDVKVGSIYEGTANIQLQTIAKMMQKEL